MTDFGLVHMKGRIYDPTLGRFLQADPHIQAPSNSQSYNRYAYVLNNPLSYTDPSGYFFKSLFKGIKKYWRQIAAIAVTYFTAGAARGWAAAWGFSGAAAGAVTGAIAGAAGGFVATGSLKGALVGAISGAAFGAIGASGWNEAGKFAATGAVGGVSSDLQGGNFGHGFWSAGLGSAAGGQYSTNAPTQVLVSAVVGGTISKLTGGKFANGAFSAAFAAALRANWGSNKLSDGQTKGELTEQETVALDKDLVALNKKIRSLKSFTNKADALKWAHDNIHPLSVKHDVEIGVNIFDDIGNVRLGNAVTDYYRHEISAATLLTSSIKGWEKGWVANWHSHAAGESGGFSYADHKLYSSWSQSNPNVTSHMSRINLNSNNQLDTYIGEYHVQRF